MIWRVFPLSGRLPGPEQKREGKHILAVFRAEALQICRKCSLGEFFGGEKIFGRRDLHRTKPERFRRFEDRANPEKERIFRSVCNGVWDGHPKSSRPCLPTLWLWKKTKRV